MDVPYATTAPPYPYMAEFEVIVQFVTVKVVSSLAKTAPPQNAEFEVIVHWVVVTVDRPNATTAPPPYDAEFKDIVQ